MARNGTVKTSGYGDRGWAVAVDWSISSQSTSDNTTNLYYKIYAPNDGYSNSWAVYYNVDVSINGTNVYSQSSGKTMYRNDTFKTGTITIPHTIDGTKSVNISISAGITSSAVNRSTSQAITLDTILRGITDLSLASGWSDIDSEKTITFTKLSNSATVKVYWQYWDNEKNERSTMWIVRTPSGTEITNFTTGQALKLQTELVDEIHRLKPESKKATVYITVYVEQQGQRIQTFNRQVELNLRLSGPIVDFTVSFTGVNQSLLGSSNRGVQGVHKLGVNVNSTGQDGARITRNEITYDGKKYNGTILTLDALESGTRTISVRAYDSRGRYNTVTRTVTVIPYFTPVLTNHRNARYEGASENPLGKTARIEGSIRTATVTDANGTNINAAYWRLSLNNNTRVNSSGIFHSLEIPIAESRSYRLEYGDMFTSAYTEANISSANVPLTLGKKSVGIGTVPPIGQSGLWIDGEGNFARSVNFPVGSSREIIRTGTGYTVGTGNGLIIGEVGKIGVLILDGQGWTVDVDTGSRIKQIW